MLNDHVGDDAEEAQQLKDEWVEYTAQEMFKKLSSTLPDWLIDESSISSEAIWEATWKQAEILYKDYKSSINEP